MLAYPFGYDQSVFSVGGEMSIKHGAVTYRDFLDTKPPLVFTIYGISSVVFGHHEWSPRALDILFHIVTLFYFYRILRRTLRDERVALFSVVLYALFYATSGFWMTAQAETFALLPSLWIFSLSERTAGGANPLRNGILAGVATLFLFLLKFTLVTVAAASIVYLFIARPQLKFGLILRYIGGLVLGFAASAGLYIFYLYSTGAATRFFESIEWLRGYAAVTPFFTIYFFSEYIFRIFPGGVLQTFWSFTVFLAILGIWNISYKKDSTTGTQHHLLLQIGFGLLGIISERKFFPYHYSRLYWCVIPFIAIGAPIVWRRAVEYFSFVKDLNGFPKTIRLILFSLTCAAAIFFSPMTRIFSNCLYWPYIRMSGKNVGEAVASKFGQTFYQDQDNAAMLIHTALEPNDNIFLWGNSVGLYYRLERYPSTICLTNTPFVTAWTPKNWKDTLLRQLQSAPPRFFITETGDARAYITGDSFDSEQHLEQWSELNAFVRSNYHDWKTIGHFVIHEKN